MNKMEHGGKRTKGRNKHGFAGNPLISVITIVFNGEKYIENTIKSVIGQSYKNIEYIIIDGNSTDKTLEIIKKYEEFIDYWRSEADNGISDGFNKGFSYSTGDFIAYLNSDDWYEQNGITEIVKGIELHSAIYCGHLNLYSEGSNKFIKVHKSNPKRLLQTMRIAHPSTFVSREVFGFSFDYKYAMDYDFILRAWLNGFEIKVINHVIANQRLGGNSSNLKGVFKDELYVKNRNLGYKLKHWLWYYLNLLFHKPYTIVLRMMNYILVKKKK
jgi:glycosyltransferase involved in cell wall biosynthesis